MSPKPRAQPKRVAGAFLGYDGNQSPSNTFSLVGPHAGESIVELRHFRYFIAVAEELHFGRAATRLHMSQQPLSAQIRSLEQEIGAELFHRAENRIRLTEAGKVFLTEARGAVDAADRAISRTRDAAEGRSGILRVGYCVTAVGDTLTRTLERLSTQRPALRFELFDCHGDDAIIRLRDHEIDLAIAHVPADPRGLEHVPLFAERYLIGVRADDLLADKSPLSPHRSRRTPNREPAALHASERTTRDRSVAWQRSSKSCDHIRRKPPRPGSGNARSGWRRRRNRA